MIETISLCNVCYKKIPASIVFENGLVLMKKTCDVHGHQMGIVEKDPLFVSNFYKLGTQGNNNTIIVHAWDKCNMSCRWCYYPPGQEKIHDPEFIHVLFYDVYRGFNLLLSGGEPTIRPDYFRYVKYLYDMGWNPASITNMLKLSDDEFFERTLNSHFVDNQNNYRFAMSFQHPKNYSNDILKMKMDVIAKMDRNNLKASCCMFSIQSLDELDWIKDFYEQTKHLFHMFRIRTLFHNWANKGEKELYLSDLHKAFMKKWAEYTPIQWNGIEHSNIYCLYMLTKEGRNISLASSPILENLDYHLTSRPVYMLARDLRCYPVPITQIVNEGIEKGWKDGFKIGG